MAARNSSRGARPAAGIGGNRPRTHPTPPIPPAIVRMVREEFRWPELKAQEVDALTALNEARSILVCIAFCLEEMCDPHRCDVLGECAPEDVSVVVRLGIKKLDEARRAVDKPEGAS